MSNIFSKTMERLRPKQQAANDSTPASASAGPQAEPTAASLTADAPEPETAGQAAANPEPKAPEPGFAQTTGGGDFIDVYMRGVFNGTLKLDKDPFIERIAAHQNIGLFAERIAETANEITHAKAQLAKRLNAELAQAAANTQHAHLQHRIAVCQTDLDENKNLVQHYRQKAEAVKVHYAWPVVCVFLVFGLVFIIADFSLTYNALSGSALNIGDEGWLIKLLALAVSGTGILLKPAFERIFEHPYQKAVVETGSLEPIKERKRNHGFLISMAIVAISCLLLLGVMRGLGEQIKYLQNEIDKAQTDRSQNMAGASGQKNSGTPPTQPTVQSNPVSPVADLEAEKKQKQELVNNLEVFGFFPFLALLFAMGSSICIELGLTGINKLYKRHRLGVHFVHKFEALCPPFKETLARLHEDAKPLLLSLSEQGVLLANLPTRKELEDLLAKHIAQHLELRVERKKAYTERLQASYRDGYNHGQFREMSGGAPQITYASLVKIFDETMPGANPATNRMDGNTAAAPERPFIEVRRRIAREAAQRENSFGKN